MMCTYIGGTTPRGRVEKRKHGQTKQGLQACLYSPWSVPRLSAMVYVRAMDMDGGGCQQVVRTKQPDCYVEALGGERHFPPHTTGGGRR